MPALAQLVNADFPPDAYAKLESRFRPHPDRFRYISAYLSRSVKSLSTIAFDCSNVVATGVSVILVG